MSKSKATVSAARPAPLGSRWIAAHREAEAACARVTGLRCDLGDDHELPPGLAGVHWSDCQARFLLKSVREKGNDLDELRQLARWVRDTFGLENMEGKLTP